MKRKKKLSEKDKLKYKMLLLAMAACTENIQTGTYWQSLRKLTKKLF